MPHKAESNAEEYESEDDSDEDSDDDEWNRLGMLISLFLFVLCATGV